MKRKVQWNYVKSKVINNLQVAFLECPQCHFSEHDVHSVLYRLTQKQLKQQEKSSQTTLDGYKTSLVHHEYPTPFRCDMQGYNFRRTGEEERTPKGGLYKRGHYDLVILNPDFVKNHTLDIVCGKNYKKIITGNPTQTLRSTTNLGLRNHLLPKKSKNTQKRDQNN